MSKLGARLILLVLLLLTCVPVGMYFIGGDIGGNSAGQTQISELAVPDEDPVVGENDAIEVVLERLPQAGYDNILDFSQTYQEGGWVYEGTIQGKKAVYSYQVDGENGNLLQWQVVKKLTD